MKTALIVQVILFGVIASVVVVVAAREVFKNEAEKDAVARKKKEQEKAEELAPIHQMVIPQPEDTPRIAATANPFLRLEGSAADDQPQTVNAETLTDRITAEAVDSLFSRPTMMIWLFDASPSAERLRTDVSRRLIRNYEMLSAMKQNGHTAFQEEKTPALLTLVGTFGKEVEFLTPQPTDDNDAVVDALRRIREEQSGEERTFEAISRSLSDFSSARTAQRRTMIVVVSDERGDDHERVDEVVPLVEKYAIAVFVIGAPAPFGREGTMSKFPAKENGPAVTQSPESLGKEWVAIDEWQVAFDTPMIDSGFGPFALSRLAVKSGGAYYPLRAESFTSFGAQDNELRFDAETMAAYKPDYVSKAGYEQILNSNKACRALHDAAQMNRIVVDSDLTLEFYKKDEASLKRLLDKGQQTAARMDPILRPMYATLQAGESDRAKLTSPRWQAGYDLAMGRILAIRARIEGYNSALAQLKAGRTFPKEGQDTWVLKPTSEFKGDSNLEKLVKQSKMYLERVVNDHPNTPWAAVAKRELQSPAGWEWDSR